MNISTLSPKDSKQYLQILSFFFNSFIVFFSHGSINIFITTFTKLKFCPCNALVTMVVSFCTFKTTHDHDNQTLNAYLNNDIWHNDRISNYAYSLFVYKKSRTTYKSIKVKFLITISTNIQIRKHFNQSFMITHYFSFIHLINKS